MMYLQMKPNIKTPCHNKIIVIKYCGEKYL